MLCPFSVGAAFILIFFAACACECAFLSVFANTLFSANYTFEGAFQCGLYLWIHFSRRSERADVLFPSVLSARSRGRPPLAV